MKIKDLLEGAVGYIAKNKKEANDPRYSMSITQDVKPGETERQAAKFGNEVPPPVFSAKAAKNSTPNKLMNLGLTEAENPKALQKDIITKVKQTTDTGLLHKVLNTLSTSGLEERLMSVLSKDTDAKKFLSQIANIITTTEGTPEERSKFIEEYPKGFVDTKTMLNGKPHALSDIIKDPFALKVFLKLSTIKEQGVGPGEIALGIMSPDIKWVGQSGGGGDILVNGKKVEVKGRLSAGGRWFDARKASRDDQQIKRTFAKLGVTLGSVLNVNHWIELRETNSKVKKNVKEIAKIIAESNFKFAKTNKLVKELVSGDRASIEEAFLEAGYENYQTYSKFDGMLLLDVGGGNALQYFNDFASMKDKIHWGTVYLFAPPSDAMPKVVLKIAPSGATNVKKSAPAASNKKVPVGVPTDSAARKPVNITARKPKLNAVPAGAGREKR